MRGNGVKHMDAGQNIRGSIGPVEKAHHFNKNIVPGELRRPQQVSIRINRGYDQEQGHSRIEECYIMKELFPVFEK
jgi:hypothetical protein